MEMFSTRARGAGNGKRPQRWLIAALFGALAAQTIFAAVAGSLGRIPGSMPPRAVQTLPALPLALVDDLKRQDGTQTKGRLQIGLGRALDKPMILSRETVAVGDWSAPTNGWHGWSMEVTSKGALGVRLHLENLTLPAGVQLVVYDPAKPESTLATISVESLAGQREVWTKTIFSERVAVECQVPPQVDVRDVYFQVGELSHLYALPALQPTLMAASCENDVTCSAGYATEASGVALISFIDGGNSYLCSGCLIASSLSNVKDYFLTAHHCIDRQTVASTVEFFWFFQSSVCNGPAPSMTDHFTTGGGDLLATSSENDFSFMQLRKAAPNNAFHLNWTTSVPSTSETLACIHHPDGGEKRISFGNLIGSDLDFFDVQWFSGVTEPGSSGSPLLNGNHQIVGQLYAGSSSCSDQSGPDEFGRFDVTYEALKTWLGAGGGTNGSRPPAGTYYGLYSDPTNGVAQVSSGAFSITVTAKGKFTGKLQTGNRRYAFRGLLDNSGAASVTVPRPKQTPLNLQLEFGTTVDPDHVSGTLGDGTWSATLSGNRAIYNGRRTFPPEAGQYTMVVSGSADANSAPGGDSFCLISVDKNGRLRMTGLLADGTPFSQSVPISKGGQWPLYVSLYAGKGSLFSWIQFSATATTDLSGDVAWSKPNIANAKYYPQAFTVRTNASGSRFNRPTNAGNILNLTSAQLVVEGTSPNQSVTNQVVIDAKGRVTNSSKNNLTMTISTSNGAFKGQVLDSDSSKQLSFRGVVLQKQNAGAGVLFRSKETTEVLLQSSAQ